mmetsp:Transcript_67455/g.106766  ORF Transcript_67455/g.106766 Transcript_67455/m.106766 type:complete len:108 (-) Transcript_67455:47-370(-)
MSAKASLRRRRQVLLLLRACPVSHIGCSAIPIFCVADIRTQLRLIVNPQIWVGGSHVYESIVSPHPGPQPFCGLTLSAHLGAYCTVHSLHLPSFLVLRAMKLLIGQS